MKKLFRLTQSGVDELKAELALLLKKRGQIAEAIKNARELGDLTENAEYQSARAEQDRNDTRIMEVENILQNVEADPLSGKISDESPIGRALLGKEVGDKVDITTPADTTTFKIVSIS
jgi:transcription elongation factor GreA